MGCLRIKYFIPFQLKSSEIHLTLEISVTWEYIAIKQSVCLLLQDTEYLLFRKKISGEFVINGIPSTFH